MRDRNEDDQRTRLGRRSLLQAGMLVPVGGSIFGSTATQARPAVAAHTGLGMPILLSVNGREHRLVLDPRTTLLDALREHIGLTGSKKGCDHGQCGACTVHIDGRSVLGCLTLAAAVQGRPVATIEGLAHGERLHPMQAAFIEHDALQCGYCTPGQILSALGCVQEGHAGTDGEISEYMSGNLCRCAAYPNIVASIRDAAPKMKHV